MKYLCFFTLFLGVLACGSSDEPNTDPLVVDVNNVNNQNNATNNSNNSNNVRELPDFSPYFDLDRVMQIDIELPEDDWDELRAQTRTFVDIIGGEDCLDQPIANVFTWFMTDSVTVDGVLYPNVGIRKKGLLGSLSSSKPSLKLKFDRYIDGQRLDDIVERITLNNSRQDPSKMNTCLAYSVFRSAGIPAPRCNFARVSINGVDAGVFIHVEDVKKRFLREHFEDEDGNLYEGTLSDFREDWYRTFEKKTNEEENDFSDIEQMVEAFERPGDDYRDALDAAMYTDQFLTFWAVETIVAHWDGYAGNRNNFFIYREPDDRFHFIPWGADAAFRPFDGGPQSIRAQGGIPHRFYNDPVMQPQYLDRVREVLDEAWDEDALNALVDSFDVIIQEHALPEERAAASDDIPRIRDFISDRRATLLAEMEGPEPWNGPLPGPICWVEIGSIDATFQTTWGTRDLPDPINEGSATLDVILNDVPRVPDNIGAVAGFTDPDPNVPEPMAEVRIISSNPDGVVDVWLIRVPQARFRSGETIGVGFEAQAILVQLSPPMNNPQVIGYVAGGTLVLEQAGLNDGDPIVGQVVGPIIDVN